MECREARELLSDELDVRLAPSDAKRLEEHVASCAECAKERRELAALRETFRASPRVRAPADFAGGVMSSLPKGRVRSLPRALGWIVAVAAVVVVAVTLIPKDMPSAERETATGAAARAPAKALDRDETWKTETSTASPPPEPAAPAPPAAKADGRFAEHDAKAKQAESVKLAAPESKDAPAPAPSVDSVAPAGVPPAKVVRYVVFRDAAAAERFANELASADAAALERLKPAEPAAKPPSGPDSGGGGGGAPKVRREDTPAGGKNAEKGEALRDDAGRSNVAKEAAFAARRVVSRAPLPASVADADLAKRAAVAGGTLVPSEEAQRFAALLDAPGTQSGVVAPQAEGASPAESQLGTDAETRKRAAPPAVTPPPAAPPVPAGPRRQDGLPSVIVVIVVLEPAPPAGDGKR